MIKPEKTLKILKSPKIHPKNFPPKGEEVHLCRNGGDFSKFSMIVGFKANPP